MDGEKKKLKFSLGYLIVAFWAVLLLQQVFSAYLQPTRTSYSDFKAAVAAAGSPTWRSATRSSAGT